MQCSNAVMCQSSNDATAYYSLWGEFSKVLASLLSSVTFPVPVTSSVTVKRTLVLTLVGEMYSEQRSVIFKVFVFIDMKKHKAK